MALRAVLADDEPLARRRLAMLLREAGVEVLAELADGGEVLDWFSAGTQADVLFLDIQMPGLTGLEVLAELKDPPPVVFVTAHLHYAIQAFEAAAVDYLLKPVSEARLRRTLDRLQAHQVPRRKGAELAALLPAQGLRLHVKAGEGFVFLEMRKITHFEVEEEVVWAWAGERYRTSWTTLGEVEEALPGEGLVRIHRHLLLRPQAAIGFKPLFGGRGAVRIAGNKDLDVSRGCVPKLKAALGMSDASR